MTDNHKPDHQIQPSEPEAIRHLRQAIIGAKHWYLALLEAIGRWDAAEETVDGRSYRYLIAGEAFDWLVLAERLCQAADCLIPETEKIALLFHGKPPLDLSDQEFKRLIGGIKHHQYLNYFYGVTVEEALVLAAEEEIRKERRCAGYYREKDVTNEAFRHIYGATKTVLLRRFRREKGYPQHKSINLTALKEFTYWLFRHRLKQSDRARVASDTRKGLDWLEDKGSPQYNKGDGVEQERSETAVASMRRTSTLSKSTSAP